MAVLHQISILFLIPLVVLCNPTNGDKWQAFKKKYNKVFEDHNEEEYRRTLFIDHLQQIEGHNRKYEQGIVTYSVGINQFIDRHIKEIAPGSQFIANQSSKIQKLSAATLEVPDSIDWRDFGVITPVVDQDFCLACWAFAVVATVEAHVGIYLGQKQQTLSQENLVDCVYPHFTCDQTLNRTALADSYQYIIDNGGIDTAQSYPYNPFPTGCHFKPENVGAKIKDFIMLPEGDEDQLKIAVGTIGPVSVIITTDYSFTAYRHGIYYKEDCLNTSEPFNHAVTIIGYGTEDGQDYWLVRNEWGTFFGEEGYIKMARNRDNNCGIATYASYPLIDGL